METQTAQKKIKPPVMSTKNVHTQLSKGQSADVRSILHGSKIQPKLRIGQPNDKYEQEADRVADKVMRMPALQSPTFSDNSRLKNELRLDISAIQRTCSSCEKDEQIIQAETRGNSVQEVTPKIQTGV
ncbi:MAG: hypothetical protein OEX11_08725, partial [Nitrosomonas sp.]|nr:hypothetical protein [Nitrosomonas sp.]